jgi:hypothetical protein
VQIGLAVVHGGFVFMEHNLTAWSDSGHEVRDFGAYSLAPGGITTRTLSSLRPERAHKGLGIAASRYVAARWVPVTLRTM